MAEDNAILQDLQEFLGYKCEPSHFFLSDSVADQYVLLDQFLLFSLPDFVFIGHLWHFFFVAILSQLCRLADFSICFSACLFKCFKCFFVFSVDHLIPRMRECLEGTSVPQRSDAPTGRELIKLYATDYFTKMSEVSYFELLERSREASVHSRIHRYTPECILAD